MSEIKMERAKKLEEVFKHLVGESLKNNKEDEDL
jgi:hypothetical protein